MSARAELSERIAAFIRDNEIDNPFGGESERLEGNRFYSILLSKPRVLDGLVKVYSPKFIQILLQGPLVYGSESKVFESEENAIAYLKAVCLDYNIEAADAIPTKERKS